MPAHARKRQLAVLFSCSLVHWIGANGLVPLLPIYASQLGADPALTGYYLAFLYLGLASGSLSAGWLSGRLKSRKGLYIVAGLANVPAVWLMGRATDFALLTLVSTLSGFLIGLGLALISILTGLFAGDDERGRIFGIIALTIGLGSIIGGLTLGPAADRWGYPAMLFFLALFYLLWPLLGLFLRDEPMAPRPAVPRGAPRGRLRLSAGFYLLLPATVLVTVGSYVSHMGRSLAMIDLGFPSAAISSTTTICGLVILPLRFAIGWLSDRIGRKRLMVLCYLVRTVGLLAMCASKTLWQFWVTAVLLTVPASSRTLADALVTDLVPRESLGTAMSLFGAMTWVAGILGFAVTGQAVQRLGLTTTLVVTASLPVIASLLLIPIREEKQEEMAPKG